MKQVFFCLLLFIGLSVLSCKKDPTDVPIGTISASISGSVTTFNISARASTIPVQGGYGIKISGFKKDPATSGTKMEIIIVRPTAITAGTYNENTTGNPLVEINFFQEFLWGSGWHYSRFQSTTNPVTVTISSLSSTSVKGTFQGELQATGFSGEILKTQVTNGVFYVSF